METCVEIADDYSVACDVVSSKPENLIPVPCFRETSLPVRASRDVKADYCNPVGRYCFDPPMSDVRRRCIESTRCFREHGDVVDAIQSVRRDQLQTGVL